MVVTPLRGSFDVRSEPQRWVRKLSYELLGAVASLGTLVVIAATAVAAIVQLRHIRASNQLSIVLGYLSQVESDEMQQRLAFVRNELAKKMEDPSFRAGLEAPPIDRTAHPEMYVMDYYDNLGRVMSLRLVDDNVILGGEAFRAMAFWKLLEPTIGVIRRYRPDRSQYADFFVDFEYLVSRARQYASDPHVLDRLPYFPRIPITDKWSAVDTQPLSDKTQ